ncbi:helix-turn-helix transcriptional regulator [Lactobacillus sp.]|uniref:helix-turn-helix domain-containing protein n=1 Tax=Lactobacillus sp. TaxID=1591 RepID=UPI0025ECD1C4|nr:helix-turn-helix transcriptional regulator [Lactobacillus sp.]MCO6533946.1 helix-turn-helix transcriptional regulator [Lactobacillus sp.]
MKTFGETIQKIRKSRGITQAELSNNLLNRTTLSKIENSLEEPSYQNASRLIKRLGITQVEFDYIRNDYNFSPKEKIIFDFFNIAYNTESTKIDTLLKRCSEFPDDNEIKKISLILKAFNSENLNSARKIILPFWQSQGSKVDNWNILDLYLLNMIFFVFDEESMIGISNRAIETIENKYPFLESLEENFALNKAVILMNMNKFDSAARILLKAISLAKSTFRYDKLFMAKGRLAICQKNKEEAVKCLNTLKAMEALDVYRGLQTEIKEFADRFNEN